jgi:serine/threonine protein kinase
MSEPKNRTAPEDASKAAHPVTGARLAVSDEEGDIASAPTSAPLGPSSAADRGTRLRVVNVAPGTNSFPDIEAPSIDRRDPYVGSVIDGRYRVETVVGEGGMGVVYRCTHKIIGKKLALKVLRSDLARDQEVTERFLNEAKAASAIGNPHIIDISDFGQFQDGATYFVMEYLAGRPLSSILVPGEPLPNAQLLHIGRQLAEGLAAAHEAGIVHRDLKPDNVFLIERGSDKDFVKILDFGIAKVSTSEGKLTRAGTVFGTPHYMSPEQAAGTSVDHRGDIYSLGIILFEMACGRIPFDADNFMGVLTQHMYKAPPGFSDVAARPNELPPGLEAVVMKCLAKRPEARYQSMAEVMADLDKLRGGQRPSALFEMAENPSDFSAPGAYFDADPGSSHRRKDGVRPWLLALSVATVALVGIAAFFFTRSSMRPQASVDTSLENEPARVLPAAEAPKAQVGPAITQVLFATDPLDAHVFKGNEDLGVGPVSLDVPQGQAVEVVVRREGYQDARVIVDGTEQRQSIKLEPLTPTKAVRPAATKPTAPTKRTATPARRPSIGGAGIIDPWK